MKKFFIVSAAALIICLIIYKLPVCNTDPLLLELDRLAKENEMEFVFGNKFPALNPYGSYGAPCVFDFLFSKDAKIDKSVLFLCRKKDKSYVKKWRESPLDLINNYKYFMVFAVKTKNESTYVVRDILEDIGLKGVTLYYGRLSMKLSQFYYIDCPEVSGPQGLQVSFLNGCVPIVISGESSTQILYYYQGKWLEYVERDE